MRTVRLFVGSVILVSCGGEPTTDLPKEPVEADADTDADTDTDTDTDTDADLTCEHWCSLMDAHCAENSLHPEEACMTYCKPGVLETFPTGSAGDTDVDTLACRIHWAEKAAAATDASEKAAYCEYANASGGDQCGGWCEVYCSVFTEVCTETVVPQFAYPSREACEAACAPMGTDVLPGIAQPEQLFGYGDTVQCRLHHLHAAVVMGETQPSMYGLHCPHASEDSTPDTCDQDAPPNVANYCAYATDFCTGDDTLFPDVGPNPTVAECSAVVSALVGPGRPYAEGPFPTFTDQSGSTLGCLNYWIVQTPLDPDVYCKKADWDPDNWSSAGGEGVCHD